MSSFSTSSSLRLCTTKIPYSLRFSNTLIPPPKPHSLYFFKALSFERIPTAKLPSPSSISASASASASASTPTSLQPIEELPPKLQEMVKLFQSVQEPKAKYEQLLFYSKCLKPLDTQFKTKANKVEGCVSQVWVRAYFDSEKNVVFEADSDSVLTKGLAALLVQGLLGRPVKEILRISPDFVVLLGLQQSLTPSRNNGLLNMLKLMQKKALELLVESENSIESETLVSKRDASVENGSVGLEINVGFENLTGRWNSKQHSDDLDSVSGSVSEWDSGYKLGSRGKRIREKLERELGPAELQVEDISYQHAGHSGVRGSDGETHFNLKVVSQVFEGKSLVKRHRLIYDLLQEELQSGLHALSIVAQSPSEAH